MLRGTVSVFIKQAIADEEDEAKIAQHSDTSDLYDDKGQLDRPKLGHFITKLGQ